jgi:hypothetical protein
VHVGLLLALELDYLLLMRGGKGGWDGEECTINTTVMRMVRNYNYTKFLLTLSSFPLLFLNGRRLDVSLVLQIQRRHPLH